ncbi:MAG: response regulator [Parcubacteria group bacterium]|nr:response regulator [Parcubacteria group bacterium]
MPDEKKSVVLLAEDDQFLQRMYATKLSQAGLEVVAVSDGAKAIEAASSRPIDLAVLDILMPKKDGFEVLRELRANGATRAVPVIMLTNLGEAGDINEAKRLGANEYIIKAHLLPSEVVEVIKKYL